MAKNTPIYDDEIDLIGTTLDTKILVYSEDDNRRVTETVFGAKEDVLETAAVYRTADGVCYGIMKNAPGDLVRSVPSAACIGRTLPHHQLNFYTAFMVQRDAGVSIEGKALSNLSDEIENFRLVIYNKILRLLCKIKSHNSVIFYPLLRLKLAIQFVFRQEFYP